MAEHDVAIIGMSGRFPGARDVNQFWENLRNGVDSVHRASEAEAAAAGLDPRVLREPRYVNASGPIEGVELFDAAFFGYSPREAQTIDPQQRLFLESAWLALEDAGYDPADAGLVGVWAGSANSSYVTHVQAKPELVSLVGGYQIAISNDKDHLANRVSYKLDLRGPSVNVQTACSTSLVAVCCAYQALVDHQCDLALAGGVCVRLPQVAGYYWQPDGILSPDGHCRPFDAEARGTRMGNGVAVVGLKRLTEAIADGDHIYAVIRGAAMNNDGADKSGYTAPSVAGQSQAITWAQALARVEPDTITYIEAHGTGTSLGDPIEIQALTEAFRAATSRTGYCAIGSVKSNIGHLDPAAGIASLIKTALALEHREIPPSVHYNHPNPQIDFERSPFFVNDALRPWTTNGAPRRAGVSSFGIGGTNCHVILEEAPAAFAARAQTATLDRLEVLPLSARSESALVTAARNLAAHLRAHPDLAPEDVAFTLQLGRRSFEHRIAAVVRRAEEVPAVLAAFSEHGSTANRAVFAGVAERSRPVAFLFPGQGTQHRGMGRGLYESQRVFRDAFDECAALFAARLGIDLQRVLYADEARTLRRSRSRRR